MVSVLSADVVMAFENLICSSPRRPRPRTLHRAKAKRPFQTQSDTASLLNYIRRLPTLPRSCPRSTIGSRGLNFRVRDGNGCDPSDTVTGKLEKLNRQSDLAS